MQETPVRSLGWEDPLKKGKATTPVFWPGEFHGLYSPWGHKESDTTERLSLTYVSGPELTQTGYLLARGSLSNGDVGS